MKQLTKEQLTEMVHDTMVGIYDSNKDDLMKEISDPDKNIDPNLIIVNAMAILGAEIMRECNQVLIETLYNILYTE